ncbi:alkylhydroperoxidase [beta proteobacterium AAP51]|nr:alkylhydroperoxidase [beta proteobacterium AAP51]
MTAPSSTAAVPPISRYPVPELHDLPEDLRARMLEVQQKAGFVPNVFLALAHRPAEWRAFMAYHDALLLKDSGSLTNQEGSGRGLTKGEREMIIVATSAANHCLYCVVAHGAILRVYEKKPLLADQLAVNHRKADITPRQRAMLDFAMKVCTASHTVDEADFEALRGHGFDDEDIWDIGAITAFFGLSNRMANLTAMRPNDEFFLMGRVPRPPKA